MMANLSPRAQRLIIALAPDEAYKLGSESLLPEHVILALIKSGDGLGFLTLKHLHINFLTLQIGIEQGLHARIPSKELKEIPYSDRMLKMLSDAEAFSKMLDCPYVGTEHILLAAVNDKKTVLSKIFDELKIGLEGAKEAVKNVEKKVPSSFFTDEGKVSGRDIEKFSPIDRGVNFGFQNFQFNHDDEDSENPLIGEKSESKKNNFQRDSFLAKFSRDLTKEAKKENAEIVVGRKKEISRILQILSRKTKNNPVLIGEPGVGKTAIVEGLAQEIANGRVPLSLADKRVISLDLTSIVAGTRYRGDFEERMKKIIKEIKESKNIILFIDELHTLIGAGGPEGALDASNILKPALSRSEIQIIGATTLKEYRKYIEKDASLERRFQKILVEEPGISDAEEILRGIQPSFEKYHNVIYDDDVVETIVKYSKRYIPERFLPDKAIDILDECGAVKKIQIEVKPQEVSKLEEIIKELTEEKNNLVANQNYEEAAKVRDKVLDIRKQIENFNSLRKENNRKNKLHVTKEDVLSLISQMTGIPLSQMDDVENLRLSKMEDELHKEVIGQDQAVNAISAAVRRSRAGISSPKRPLGSFIFLGPTGVGKTQLAKALAKFLFGSEDFLIRVDMSDYIEKINVTRLTGAAPGYIGYEEGGTLTEKVRQHPYSVVLFDEIEKAHPDVFNILLQILEEGQLSDNFGHMVSFRNTLILMTSNAGARKINQESKIGFASSKEGLLPYQEIKSSAMEELKKIMTPELLNRIDDILVFNTLSQDDISKILDIQLQDLNNRLSEKNLKLKVTKDARKYFIENGYEASMGARPMRRLLQSKIEDKLANLLLSGTRNEEDCVTVDFKNDEITVKYSYSSTKKKSKAKKENSKIADTSEKESEKYKLVEKDFIFEER